MQKNNFFLFLKVKWTTFRPVFDEIRLKKVRWFQLINSSNHLTFFLVEFDRKLVEKLSTKIVRLCWPFYCFLIIKLSNFASFVFMNIVFFSRDFHVRILKATCFAPTVTACSDKLFSVVHCDSGLNQILTIFIRKFSIVEEFDQVLNVNEPLKKFFPNNRLPSEQKHRWRTYFIVGLSHRLKHIFHTYDPNQKWHEVRILNPSQWDRNLK